MSKRKIKFRPTKVQEWYLISKLRKLAARKAKEMEDKQNANNKNNP